MTLQLSHKRAGRRWLTLIVGVALLTAMFGVAAVFAVHDETFQLDGDIAASTVTHIPASATQTVDWDSIFNSSGGDVSPLPTGYDATAFHKDFSNTGSTFLTSDPTTFATGSKDTLPISGWQCNADSNVNSKIDIMNAYAVSYTATNDDEILYYALERNTNTGDANVGFWFLQDAVGCTSPGGSVTFTGAHRDGDLLIVSAFTNGGDVSNVDVYRWDGGANGALNTTPVFAGGVDCRKPTLSVGDFACAAANRADITGIPWLTSNAKDKVGNKLRTSEFFEGGINLTGLDLGGKCFNTFLADTRSSQSLTATLFDFASDTIGECTSTTVTTPSVTGSTQIPADPNAASISVTDSALITVDGADSFDATVSFSLCGPYAAASTTTCDSGGVAVGSPAAVTSSPATVVSDAAIVTEAGRYCWRADFSGDSDVGVPPSSDHSSGECFVVTPRQPTLTTQAIGGPVAFGQPISDTVTLGNTAHQEGTGGPAGSTDGSINPATLGADAGGTVSVVAYGPGSCSTVAFTSGTITVAGDGSYGGAGTAFQFTPLAPGQYVFVASYTGDLENTLGVSAGTCAGAPASEKVTVQQIGTDIKSKQSWIPNDKATVSAESGNLVAGGSVLFELFTNATCSGSSVFSQTVAVPGGSTSAEVGTTNTTSYVINTGYADPADSSVGRHSWRITYTPALADTAHTGSRSTCDSEHFNITYTNDAGPGTDLP
jgi:hypothetical protein